MTLLEFIQGGVLWMGSILAFLLLAALWLFIFAIIFDEVVHLLRGEEEEEDDEWT